MNKQDYQINISDAAACTLDEDRWSAARRRQPTFAVIYDLRLDKKRLQNVHKIFKRSDTAEKLRAALESDTWPEIPSGCDQRLFVFHGFVRRILQGKDRSYYVETKDIDRATYDHETGWFGFTAYKCNVGDSGLEFRYLYEPYVPGRIVEIHHLVFNADEVRLGGQPYHLPITIGIERWA